MLPPAAPSTERHLARITQRAGNLERRFIPEAPGLLDTTKADIEVTASGPTEIIAAPGAGKFVRIIALALMADADVDLTIVDGAAAQKIGPWFVPERGGWVLNENTSGWQDMSENEEVLLDLSLAANVGGVITYTVEDA